MSDHRINFYDEIQNIRFDNAVNGDKTLLDKSVRWIRENLVPEWVFSEKDLDEWATQDGKYIKSESVIELSKKVVILQQILNNILILISSGSI